MRDYALRLEIEKDSYTEATGETASVNDVTVVLGLGDGEESGFSEVAGRPVLPFTEGALLSLRATSSGEQPEPSHEHLIMLDKGMFADNPTVGENVSEAVEALLAGRAGKTVYTFLGMEAIEAAVDALGSSDAYQANYLKSATEYLIGKVVQLQT